ADAARLDETEQGLRRPAIDPPFGTPDDGAVIGHQPEAGLQAAQRQVALAGPGGALDQCAPPASAGPAGDQPSMQDQWRASGSRMVKRAPSTLPSASVRFSARIWPPWASTIWRAIDRPRPELPPNAVPFGLEV